jgi:hypothetical protein
MTYASDAASQNRRPLTIVEIDFDTTLNGGTVERFCDGNVPLGQTFEPCVSDISYSPTKITEAGLGYRCSVSITFQDFPHPSGVGTYFGRLIGSNPYYIDRRLTVYRGFEHASFALSNMKRGDYFIKKIEGPDDRGRVKITANDILTKLDGDQAIWPPVTNGILSGSLTNSFTGSVNIGDTSNFTATSYAIVDEEIVALSAVTSATNVTISQRGAFGTTAAAHSAGATFRRISYASSANIIDRIYTLIDEGTPIDVSTYITLSEWNATRDAYFANDDVYGVIVEPSPVKDLIVNLCKQFNIAVFWDDEAQKIKLKALGPTLAAPVKINTSQHILNVGHTITRDQSKAISQVWVYFEKLDQLKGEDLENFGSLYVYQDAGIEGASGLGQPVIEKIKADMIPAAGNASASKLASRLAGQRKAGTVEVKFRLDVSDAETFSLNCGDGVEITSDLIQGADGEPVPTIFMITERARKETHVEYSGYATGIEVGNRYAAIAGNSQADYTSATTAQRNAYGFIANDSAVMSNSDAAYLIL